MKIIIKVDDWWGTSSLSVPGFKKFLDICRLFGIKIELGVIGLGLGNNPAIAMDFLNDNKWVNVYNHSFDKDYIVYQFHPVNYNDNDIYNFSKIIEFLINKGNTFVFASEI